MIMEKRIIKLRTFNCKRAMLFGYRPSLADRLIMLRSHCTHTEIQFSKRCGNISFSATTADGCKCARFKMIAYSHPERWETVLIPVNLLKEARVLHKASQMAGVEKKSLDKIKTSLEIHGTCHGPGALEYDLPAVALSFISRAKIWKPHKKKVFCTEAVFMLLDEVFPELLGSVNLQPDELTPALGDMVARDYFKTPENRQFADVESTISVTTYPDRVK